MKKLPTSFCALLLSMFSSTLAAQQPVAVSADPENSKQASLEGKLVPMKGEQVILEWSTWNGPVTFVELVAHGSSVKEGQVIARFDPRGIDKRLHELEMRLETTRVRNELAEARAGLAEQASMRRLHDAEMALEDARDARSHWEEFELGHQRQSADLNAKRTQHGIDDATDELEQLRAMYTEDELTDATEEIVLMRSIRNLEQQKFAARLADAMREFTAKVRWPRTSRDHSLALERAEIELDRQRRSVEIDNVDRHIQAMEREESLRKLTEELQELQSDKEHFMLKSPATGMLLHGSLSQYQSGQKAPRFIERSDAYSMRGLFSIVQPSDFGVMLQVPEDKFGAINLAAPVTAAALAIPDSTATGTLHVVPPQSSIYADVAANIILCWVQLEAPLEALMPGRSVTVNYTLK